MSCICSCGAQAVFFNLEYKNTYETRTTYKRLKIKKKGITQEELAAKTDISVRTIQRIENGDVDPRAYTLQAIADGLGVEYELLINSESGWNRFEQKNPINGYHYYI